MNQEHLKKLVQERDNANSFFDISFFVPCYNEAANIFASLEKLLRICSRYRFKYEILVYDDCSKDQTVKIVESFMDAHPETAIRLVKSKKNRGLGFNYIEGAYEAFGKHFMLINGDNAETDESLIRILDQLGKADIIVPFMLEMDTRTIFRKRLSRVFTTLVNVVSGHKLRYYNGPVLHIRKNILRWHPMTCGFAYQAELLCLLMDRGASVIEVQIDNQERQGGKTKAFRPLNVLSIGHSLSQIFLRRIRNGIWGV